MGWFWVDTYGSRDPIDKHLEVVNPITQLRNIIFRRGLGGGTVLFDILKKKDMSN